MPLIIWALIVISLIAAMVRVIWSSRRVSLVTHPSPPAPYRSYPPDVMSLEQIHEVFVEAPAPQPKEPTVSPTPPLRGRIKRQSKGKVRTTPTHSKPSPRVGQHKNSPPRRRKVRKRRLRRGARR